LAIGLGKVFAPQEVMDRDALDRIIARHRDRGGALLPILHEVQDAFGHVPDASVPAIAEALNLSRAEVHGVVPF
jgi:formate dehydrogenase subunit gamma